MLIVGCPVLGREWALPTWFGHVWAAAAEALVDDVRFLFVSPAWDQATHDVIRGLEPTAEIVTLDEPRRADVRDGWGRERISHMVEIRNELLAAVRERGPDRFLSIDSDIYIHPDALANLLQTVAHRQFDAVGGACYMGLGVRNNQYVPRYPSYLMHRDSLGGWERPEMTAGAVVKVDAIMALKLMTPRAYAVDYRFHHWGEDVGWSVACDEAGLSLGWDNRVVSHHDMKRIPRAVAR